MITRRTILRGIGLGSLAGAWPISRLSAAAQPANFDPYEALGVRKVINCQGAVTTLGASKMTPDLHAAMTEASRHFVSLADLQEKVGERLAALIGAPSAMVTSGAAGAIALGTCAALTGEDPDKVRLLPSLAGMRTEAIFQKGHANGYAHAVRSAGVKAVVVETRDQFLKAVGDRTAIMYYLGGANPQQTPVALEECLEVGKKAGFPVMVDAANVIPPWDNIRTLANLKVDLICISGGKDIRGPQCSGILAGRQDLIRAALLNTSPNSDAHGRPMKVGREEMVGLWLAVEKYVQLDFEAINHQWHQRTDYLLAELSKIREVNVAYIPYETVRRVPRLNVTWDEQAVGLTTEQSIKQLWDGEPRISVRHEHGPGFELALFMSDPGDEKVVARRLREIFSAARQS